MATLEQLFQETEGRIEDTTDRLRSYFHRLGEAVYADPSILPSPMGGRLLEEARNAQTEAEKAEETVKEDLSFIEIYDSKKSRKGDADAEREGLMREEKGIRLRLGALIYEQCSLGILDHEHFSSVYEDAENERELAEKANVKSFWARMTSRTALSRMKRTDESRYLDYSSLADNEENAELISGEKAAELVSRLRTIGEERAVLDAECGDLDVFIGENASRRRELEKGGLESHRTDVEDRKNLFSESLINYGNYLYDRGNTWIGECTPSAILDILQMIIEAQNEYASLNARKAQLQKAAKADDYRVMIEEEKSKIRILLGERDRIDAQIGEIEKEIQRLEGMVSKLVDPNV